MTDITIPVAHNEYRLAGTLSYLNQGAEFAGIWLFSNARAATSEDTPGAAPMATILLADPPGEIDAGTLVLLQGADALVATSGVAVWARAFNGDGATVFDCDVSEMDGVATVRLPDTTLYAGGVTRLLFGVLT